jgi:hypothetical protein
LVFGATTIKLSATRSAAVGAGQIYAPRPVFALLHNQFGYPIFGELFVRELRSVKYVSDIWVLETSVASANSGLTEIAALINCFCDFVRSEYFM